MDELPVAAKPQPNRVHRGMHSYTVQTAVEDLETGKLGEVLVDVLLQKRAFFCEKMPPLWEAWPSELEEEWRC